MFLAAGVLLGGLWMTASAAVITLEPKPLTDLLGANPAPVGALRTTSMTAATLEAEVDSQAYTNDQGLYAYLYQIKNIGQTGDHPVEMFTLYPFWGANDDLAMGYLTGDIPAGFSAGGNLPEDEGFVSEELVSIYFTLPPGAEISIGQSSAVLYLMSDYVPGEIVGNVIDGSVAAGAVVGPVPEPGTVCLLSLGGLMFLRRRTKFRGN
ncbi:MAG: hypothetical protein AMJ79_08085 [Phycisphaerae bacterium SM23_30]|nr:MAG: hypothetical protein AMJ79_08085 [Phycisphaerae bacterium SM23_30]